MWCYMLWKKIERCEVVQDLDTGHALYKYEKNWLLFGILIAEYIMYDYRESVINSYISQYRKVNKIGFNNEKEINTKNK